MPWRGSWRRTSRCNCMASASSATSSRTACGPGVRPNGALDHLQRKVDAAIRRVGQPQDAYKFTPHITVARLRHPDMEKMVDWLAYHALYTSAEFEAGAFRLYSSRPSSNKGAGDGSIYTVEEDYPLGGHDFDSEIDD